MKKQKTFFLSKETNFSEVLGSRRIFKKGHPNRIWGLLTINSPKYKITQNRFIPILLGKILTPCQTEQQDHYHHTAGDLGQHLFPGHHWTITPCTLWEAYSSSPCPAHSTTNDGSGQRAAEKKKKGWRTGDMQLISNHHLG